MFPAADLSRIRLLLGSLTIFECAQQLVSSETSPEEDMPPTNTPLTMITILPPEPVPAAAPETDGSIVELAEEDVLLEQLKASASPGWVQTFNSLHKICWNLVP